MKLKFKVGDRVRFSGLAIREFTNTRKSDRGTISKINWASSSNDGNYHVDWRRKLAMNDVHGDWLIKVR